MSVPGIRSTIPNELLPDIRSTELCQHRTSRREATSSAELVLSSSGICTTIRHVSTARRVPITRYVSTGTSVPNNALCAVRIPAPYAVSVRDMA
eukprot:1924214-Rhodomonas_salina.3